MKKYIITQEQYFSVLNDIILEEDNYNQGVQFGNIIYYPNSIRVTNQPDVVVVKDTVTQKDYALKINAQGTPVDWFRGDPSTLTVGRNKNAQNIPPSNAITNPQAGITGGAQSTSISEIVKTIVQNLEGGYYHPDMLRDGRVRDGRYGKSGETMFGMDRLRGGDFVKTPAGQRFWALIDSANARKTWKWNYYGGNLQSELIELTAQMIQPFYDKYSKSYLSPESINIVNNNYKLNFNFVYAVFNGPKLFMHLASLVNKQVASGNTNPDSLANVVLSARLNHNKSLYRQSGKKIKNILGM